MYLNYFDVATAVAGTRMVQKARKTEGRPKGLLMTFRITVESYFHDSTKLGFVMPHDRSRFLGIGRGVLYLFPHVSYTERLL